MAEPLGAHFQGARVIVISTFNIPGDKITSQVHPSALHIMTAHHTKDDNNAAEKVPEDAA